MDMAALNFSRKCGDYGRDETGELGKSQKFVVPLPRFSKIHLII